MANKVNTIVGNDSNPTKLEAGQTIINKKATKQNLDKLIHINGGTSNPKTTTDGTDGGLLKGKPHYDSKGNPTGGIPAVVEGSNRVELEGDEFVVSKEASRKHWKELSKINQSAGNGVPINPPAGADEDIDTDEFERGGKIEFNPNKLPNKNILNYALKIKEKYPKVWDLGGNIFGNEAFKNLKRVSERGYWLDSEEWMYKKWRAFVSRHKGDFRIAGVIAMLKWVDSVDKGWAYMKELIEQEIAKKYPKNKMSKGGGVETMYFDTTPEHAQMYGLNAKNPLWVQSVEKIAEAEKYAKRNGNDLIFGHNAQKTGNSKEWLAKRGYIVISENNDFYKVVGVGKFGNGGGVLLAPNGKQSNLTPEQYKLVRTPEFKAWFGDWENDSANASKVVDENGEPLVVYHGTTKEFYIFDNKEIGKNDYGYFGKGFYFGNLNASESYAQVSIWHEIHGTKNPNGRVLICFLNIRNPLVGSSENLMQSKETSSNFTNEVMKNYDGIVAVPYTRFSPNTEYICFEPNQIKLADGTNTTFDSSNPDIRYAGGGMLLVPNGNIKFMEWYVGWYKKISDKINITFSLPNELLPFKEENVVILDLFEKIDQNIDAKPYLKEIVNQADKYGVTIYLEPKKRKKISKDYLIVYYQKFGFNLTSDGNFMKRLPKINPDISFAEGGGIKGTTSRLKPKETIVFDPPLIGVNGAKLVAYTWSYEWTMLPNWEGELVSKRVSDWTQADESAETGRGIVHKFSVELPDGTTRVVSSESVPILLGFTDRSQVKVFGNLATASKTLAKQEMKLAIMEAQQKEFNEAKQSIIDKGFPAPKVEKTDRLSGYILVVGDGSCFINEDGKYNQERLDCATDNYIKNRLQELGFDVYRSNQSGQIYDLKKRIERQKRKVENLLKQDKMEDGGNLDDFDWDSLFFPSPEQEEKINQDIKKSKEKENEDWYQNSKFSKKWASTYQDAVNRTIKEYFDAKATYEDWASRQYKQNKGMVFIGGDDVFGEAKSIGSINENRRQRVLRGAKMVMDESIETLKELRLTNEEISNLLQNKMEEGGDIESATDYLLAPNGKQSNLTPEQYKLVRTPEFKAWFGDWENDPANASKVVDENGEPLVVYHGTTFDFNIFNLQKPTTGVYGQGFYFTNDKGFASNYAKGSNAKILSVFLNLRNVFYISDDDLPIGYERYSDMGNNKGISRDFTRKIISEGFDGVYAKNRYDENELVVFEPTQIKLADGTNTTFDSSNPDIRFEQGGGMTYTEYKATQFNEDENRYLPRDYFKPFEVQENKIGDYTELLKSKDGIEYRKHKSYRRVGAFDGNDLVGYADSGAVEVSPIYQKRGIGLQLIILIKELNPEHKFGNMTPQGFNLMGSYYDKVIAKKEEGGELEKGIATEREHIKTLQDLFKHKITPKEAIMRTAKDHLAENPKYYTELEKIETMAKGGNADGFKFPTPFGKPSKLTFAQQSLVRTQAFKDWFGDWETAGKDYIKNAKPEDNVLTYEAYKNVSKVIDLETGEPRVMFHGTKAEKEFFVFNTNADGTRRPYGYFAYNKEYSENFFIDGEGHLYNCFLNIKNPFNANGVNFKAVRRDGAYWITNIAMKIVVQEKGNNLTEEEVQQAYLEIIGDMTFNSKVAQYLSQAYEGSKSFVPFWYAMSRDGAGIFKDFLKSRGFDGIFYSEEFSSTYDMDNPAEFTDAYTIFDPKQVKLADGRNTDFDQNKADIRYKKGGKVDMHHEHKNTSNMNRKERLASIIFANKFEEGGNVNEVKYEPTIAELNTPPRAKTQQELDKEFVNNLIKKMNN